MKYTELRKKLKTFDLSELMIIFSTIDKQHDFRKAIEIQSVYIDEVQQRIDNEKSKVSQRNKQIADLKHRLSTLSTILDNVRSDDNFDFLDNNVQVRVLDR